MVQVKRVVTSILVGAALGVLCIIGVGGRLEGGYLVNAAFLFGMWYNRVIMGLMIGFVDEVTLVGNNEEKRMINAVIRGLIIGVLVSFAVFFSSEFRDIPSLFAGFAYGPIIDVVATYMVQRE
ncbi:MAG: hypothetical protein ACOC38_07865 [Promethearchaeia archaeon]